MGMFDALNVSATGLTAERLRMSVSAVEKHVAAIFAKLGIPETAGYSRRVLAVLRYLGS